MSSTSGRVAGLLFGANWNNASNCGSRSRDSNSNDLRSNVNMNNGGRGAIWSLVFLTPQRRENSSWILHFGGMPKHTEERQFN